MPQENIKPPYENQPGPGPEVFGLKEAETMAPERELESGLVPDDHQLEAPDDMLLGAARKDVEEAGLKPALEQKEKQERPVKSLADFLAVLEECIVEAQDPEEKRELLFYLSKIESGLAGTSLKAEQILVGQGTDQEGLVAYKKPEDKIKIDKNALNDFRNNSLFYGKLFKVAQAAKQGVADQGIRELIASRSLDFNLSAQGRQARLALKNVDEKKFLSLYDWSEPEEMAEYFLDQELALRFKRNPDFNPWPAGWYLKGVFEKAVPLVYDKLSKQGFPWLKKARLKTRKLKAASR